MRVVHRPNHHSPGKISSDRSRYYRYIGREANGAGTTKKKRFWLGRNKHNAEIAVKRLEKLWEEVVAYHEVLVDAASSQRQLIFPPDRIEDCLAHRTPPINLKLGPTWQIESLQIAEAICQGQPEIQVDVLGEASLYHALDGYCEHYKSINPNRPL